MSNTTPHIPDHIDQLMVDAATQGLAPQDRAQLDDVLRDNPQWARELDAYEMAATATELALGQVKANEPLPAGLRDRLASSAGEYILPPAPLPINQAATKTQSGQPKFSWTDGRAFGWYAATAALVALCLVLIQPPNEKVIEKVVEKPVPVKPDTTTPQAKPIADQYAELADDANTVSAAWAFNAGGKNTAGIKVDPRLANATGEVIWNSKTQTGYMKLTGLPVNDPTKEQYQLWIVDGSRTANVQAKKEGTDRIDGGVFNVSQAGEVIIPIDAKIIARQPAAFAITLETPGGVVESAGPLQVIAPVVKS